MRARRREINIFNMSLLDILCGALGAFCFMMLVALPYYKPPGEEKKLRDAQKETDRLLNEIAKMKDHMADQKSVEDLTELVKKLEAQIKLLQGEVNRLSAENKEFRRQVAELQSENQRLSAENKQLRAQVEQLRARNQQLEALNRQLEAEKQQLQAQNNQLRAEKTQLQTENHDLKGQLAQKNPFLVLTSVTPANQSVAVFLSDQNVTQRDEKSPNAKFLPEAVQSSGWVGDRVGSMPAHGIGFWLTASVIPKAEYKVYLKNTQPWFAREACTLATTLYGDLADGTPAAALPVVTLTRERHWIFLGTITIDDHYRPGFRVATAEEREAEWRAHVTPTPTPSATPGPTYGPPIPSTTTPTATVSRGPVGRTPEERAFFDAMRHMHEVMSMPNTEPGIEEKRRDALKQMEEARAKMQEARRRDGQAGGPEFPFGPPAPEPSGSIRSPAPSSSPP
jgi:cell division protein FtsB